MERLVKKNILRCAFSKCACGYESQARLQHKIGEQLFKDVVLGGYCPFFILDIGSGTGTLLRRLTERFPESKAVGMDFALGMCEATLKRHLIVVQAEAQEIPFKDNCFDLVVSNLVYQWVDDFAGAVDEVNRVLKKAGRFYFTLFGKQTLRELRFAFGELTNSRYQRIFKNCLFPPEKDEIVNSLKHYFRAVDVSASIEKGYFLDAMSLVRYLKSIGANRLMKPFFMGKEVWQKVNTIYAKNFKDNGSVYATFEVIKVRAEK